MTRRRLDVELVRRGLAPSREQAHAAIEAGRVLVGGAPATKAARLVDAGEPIRLVGDGPRFVSRGGDKLEAALARFAVDVSGAQVLDAGASTGGFTDCVLQRGAAGVVALDVGYGQLHERLRSDDRVHVVERTNLRHADLGSLGAPFDAVVADLSFISLTKVAAELVGACRADGALVLLVKPQFEAGRREVDRGRGVITDPVVWTAALVDVMVALTAAGATIMGAMPSPLTGADGNVEFLVWARRNGAGRPAPEARTSSVGGIAAAAVAEVPPATDGSER
ncbi:MAG: TlyA family RNA methyltransferase [Acidimicrobiales bacterium]